MAEGTASHDTQKPPTELRISTAKGLRSAHVVLQATTLRLGAPNGWRRDAA